MSEQLVGALIGLGGAFVGVLATAVIARWTHRELQTQETADTFREMIEKLVDARIVSTNVFSENSRDVARREFLSAAVNAKRQLYKSTAHRMLARASKELTANDYLALGYEYQQDAEFEPAQQCYLAALKLRGKSRLEEVNVRRHLGALYLSPTVLHDRERGERYFREAIGLTSGQTDDYSRYSTGYTEEMLSMSLLANRYPGSEAAIQAARASYEAMDSRNVLRQAAIDSLNLRLQPTGQVIPVPPSTTPPRPPDVVTSP